jgi:hypothetical protein
MEHVDDALGEHGVPRGNAGVVVTPKGRDNRQDEPQVCMRGQGVRVCAGVWVGDQVWGWPMSAGWEKRARRVGVDADGSTVRIGLRTATTTHTLHPP